MRQGGATLVVVHCFQCVSGLLSSLMLRGCWPALSLDRPGLPYADARRPGFLLTLLLPSHLPVRGAFYLPVVPFPLCHRPMGSPLQPREPTGMACWGMLSQRGYVHFSCPRIPPPRGYVHFSCPRIPPPRGYVHCGCPRIPPRGTVRHVKCPRTPLLVVKGWDFRQWYCRGKGSVE